MDLSAYTGNLEIWLDGLVAILLVITVIYCLVLNHRLSALRGNQAEMRKLLEDFGRATQAAESSIAHLKVASDHIGGALDERMTKAQALTDELSSITQSGARLADRIESGLVGRPTQSAGQRTPGAGPEKDAAAELRRELRRQSGTDETPAKLSESERELAEILRQAR